MSESSLHKLEQYVLSLKGPILVTGASGFIGANLFKCLLLFRKDVYAVIQLEKNWRLAEVNDEFIIKVDFNDFVATKNLVQSVAPKTVFDCAAYGSYSFEKDKYLIYKTNFQSKVNFVELLAEQSISAYVYAGSSSEYGTNCSGPSENSVCEPNSPYAVAKAAFAGYLHFMGKHRDLPCINLRLYSVYGPLEDTSRLFPNLLRKALLGQLPPLVSPTTSRDFVHVDDVIAAFVLASSKMHPGLYGEAFNIGTGTKTTIAELADIVKRIYGVTEAPKFDTFDAREWDLADWYANPRKALDCLGWQAEINLEKGLRSVGDWVAALSDCEMVAATKKTSPNRRSSLTAIVACYKDEQAIPVMHQRLTETFIALGIDYEIIFVNDASPDGSAEVIRNISAHDPKVIGITHSRNFGSQMAFRSGMELSTKDGVVLLDGDLQDPPELISSFYAKWEEGYDVIYGCRIKREMPWYWGILYKLFYRLFALFSYIKIPLDAGDFSLMNKRVVHWLLKSPERDLFVRGLRAYVGFRQAGVDYVRPERLFGRSTNNLAKNIEWAKRGIFSFSNTPLTMLTTAGFVLLLASAFSALVAIVLRLTIPEYAARGVTTLLISILMFGSLNLFAIGLVGEYVAKILTEVKGRPRLIRAALIRNGEIVELLPDGKAG